MKCLNQRFINTLLITEIRSETSSTWRKIHNIYDKQLHFNHIDTIVTTIDKIMTIEYPCFVKQLIRVKIILKIFE